MPGRLTSGFLLSSQTCSTIYVSTVMGYPGSFTGTEEENVRKWNRILEHMEFLFREANEETCHRKNPYEEAYDQAREAFTRKYGMFGEKLKTEEEKEQEKDKGYYCVHTMSDVPEYKEILDQWFAAEKELAAYRDRCMKEGMKLFTRYLWDLWD